MFNSEKLPYKTIQTIKNFSCTTVLMMVPSKLDVLCISTKSKFLNLYYKENKVQVVVSNSELKNKIISFVNKNNITVLLKVEPLWKELEMDVWMVPKELNLAVDLVLMEMESKIKVLKLSEKIVSMVLNSTIKKEVNKFGTLPIFPWKLKQLQLVRNQDLHTPRLKISSMTLRRCFGKVGCMLEISHYKKNNLFPLKLLTLK